MMTDPTWKPLAAELAETISHEVSLSDEWRSAFEHTPRHLFVADATLQEAYADESIVIKTINVGGFDWPSSSSTRPSLMAYMLMILRLEEGQSVLEIGTGSGYNAALLCHRLKDDTLVASVDLDAELVDTARSRLAARGWHPELKAVDGREIAFPGRTFDRIIVTAGARRIPAEWSQQLATDGLLVADFGGGSFPRLVKLTKLPNGQLRGRLKSRPGWFMPLRPDAGHPREYPDHNPLPLNQDIAVEMNLLAAPHDLAESAEGLAVAINYFLQPEMISNQLPDGSRGTSITYGDGSWVEITKEGTTYGGPNPHIEELTQLTAAWREFGEPDTEDLHLTVDTDGTHTLSVHGFDVVWDHW
jgi:protein-L-isoaspartate O-methyltransferase